MNLINRNFVFRERGRIGGFRTPVKRSQRLYCQWLSNPDTGRLECRWVSDEAPSGEEPECRLGVLIHGSGLWRARAFEVGSVTTACCGSIRSEALTAPVAKPNALSRNCHDN